MRLTTPVRDFFYLRLAFGSEKAAALSTNARNQHIKGDIINVDMLAEFYGGLSALEATVQLLTLVLTPHLHTGTRATPLVLRQASLWPRFWCTCTS